MTSTSMPSDEDWVAPPLASVPSTLDPPRDDAHVIGLEGEIDMLTASMITDSIEHLPASVRLTVVLDFERVTFIDSTGLSALLLADRTLRGSGRSLVLRSVSPRVLRVLHVTQLDRALTIEDG
jgi:anti-sigma B factor antagonist